MEKESILIRLPKDLKKKLLVMSAMGKIKSFNHIAVELLKDYVETGEWLALADERAAKKVKEQGE